MVKAQKEEKKAEPRKEEYKPQTASSASQKPYIERLVVLKANGAFVRSSEYFAGSNQRSSETQYKASGRNWKLIIASFSIEENAKNFIQQNPNYSIIRDSQSNLYRIVYNSYSRLGEARNDIQKVRNEFPDAWLIRG